MANEKKERVLEFLSKRINLKITYEREKTEMSDGKMIVTEPPKSIKFNRGRFKTSNPKEIEVIKSQIFFKKGEITVFDAVEEAKAKERRALSDKIAEMILAGEITMEDAKKKLGVKAPVEDEDDSPKTASFKEKTVADGQAVKDI